MGHTLTASAVGNFMVRNKRLPLGGHFEQTGTVKVLVGAAAESKHRGKSGVGVRPAQIWRSRKIKRRAHTTEARPVTCFRDAQR